MTAGAILSLVLIKVCKKCGVEKSTSNFPKQPRMISGYGSTCHECQAKRKRELVAERQGLTPAELALRTKRQSNMAIRKKENAALEASGRRMCSRCRDIKPLNLDVFVLHRRNKGECGNICRKCQNDLCKDHYEANKESYHARARAFEKANPEWQSARNLKYRADNAEKIALRLENRYKEDSLYRTKRLTSTLIAGAFRRSGFTKRNRSAAILGCSWIELHIHFEKQFVKGMSWANRSEWHIDHIVPVASATTEQEVMALNHFTNLRPMWARDNLQKSDKITHLI